MKDTPEKNTPITHAQAVALCRTLQQEVQPHGYHVALTGSCLQKDEGSKGDVDVVLYPYSTLHATPAPAELLKLLGLPWSDRTRLHYTDSKLVLNVTYGGFNTDLFFLR